LVFPIVEIGAHTRYGEILPAAIQRGNAVIITGAGDGYEEEYEDEYQEDAKEYEDGTLTGGPKEPDAEEGDDHE
ncbi:MAG: hypothetical protein HFI41_11105, partial [Lachnospiraceae bacterium]|nr:hypothetical protein [Lachnospiraceae bacterium]